MPKVSLSRYIQQIVQDGVYGQTRNRFDAREKSPFLVVLILFQQFGTAVDEVRQGFALEQAGR